MHHIIYIVITDIGGGKYIHAKQSRNNILFVIILFYFALSSYDHRNNELLWYSSVSYVVYVLKTIGISQELIT